MSARRFVLTYGGTGGHVFPAMALAAELARRGHAVTAVTDARGSAFQGATETVRITAGQFVGGFGERLAGAASLVRGTMEAIGVLKRIAPEAVVGFGGYPSLPTLAAARLRRIPFVLHEQNALAGRVNRVFAPSARLIATAFAETAGIGLRDRHKLRWTGNPVRPAIAALAGGGYAAPAAGETIELLVFGGSQGARILSELLPQALAMLPDELRGRLHVVQQCRPEDLPGVEARYAEQGIAAELSAFFDDMERRLATAHLVVARSGASTIAELAAAGRPALLIPYPYAMDDHQTVNARQIEARGAALVTVQKDLTPQKLAAALDELLFDGARLEAMAQAAAGAARTEAAATLADLVEEVATAPAAASRTQARSMVA